MDTTSLKFTPRQCDIIDHRLEMPDCIEGACEDCAVMVGHDSQDVERACISLIKLIRTPFCLSDITAFDQMVLEDAITGSTYCAACESDIGFDSTQAQANGAFMSYANLVTKFKAATDETI